VGRADDRPLVLHLVYRFDVGGLENGVVNLINRMHAFRHAVVALTEVTEFSSRVRRADADFVALRKGPGHALGLYPRLYRLFREQRPAIVHTRNLAALEAVVPAWLARVPVRIHGEHGRDVGDLAGERRRYCWLRRAYRPFVSHYVALSSELGDYLAARVGVPRGRISRLGNGVDTARFAPAPHGTARIDGCPFDPGRHWLVGTVGRMQAVKDQPSLARAFVLALERRPDLAHRLRLVMVGDGPLRESCRAILETAGRTDLAWLPGERDDVDAILRGLHCFVLPSLAEGISNTILEAMASALPVIATEVGGNVELIARGHSGELVPAGDVEALAARLAFMADDPARAARMGRAGRAEVEARFGLEAMVAAYQALYESQLERASAAHGRH
jgi:sugar transferase (PEP-CTERM/EpsH1 system associated)